MMIRNIDRTFGCLLILANLGHTLGTFLLVPFMSGIFVWSLGSAVGGFVLGALNIVRAGRPHDRTLAVITALGTTGLLLIALAFGKSIGNLLDPRVLMHALVSIALIGFSVVTIKGSRKRPPLKETA